MKGRTMPRSTSKVGQRQLSGTCCDCGAADANWSSVNRGVLMCNDCASVHMTMGRHISQVKHMTKSRWHPNLLSMVQHLVSSGANSIWEHSLLDPTQMRSGKRKPNPNDNIHPTKSDFIKSKYLNLAYVHRYSITEDDSNRQLYSSVRTGNLETCLRLLSLGAHANFFNSEKGNTPLHVAAKCGQSLQVELLFVYGADPSVRDSNGKTAEEIARAENHHELADRLLELRYEVTDKFMWYVCGEVGDHKSGKHYFVPKIREPVLMSQEGKKRLTALSNQSLEVLAMDVYDEVERRELEKIWQEIQKNVLVPGKASNPALQTEVVPFLLLHPEYSSTRNQGRQKLALFKEAEFKNFLCDILTEVMRREHIIDPTSANKPHEEPIYDVPPDENDDEAFMPNTQTVAVKPVDPPKETIPKDEYLALRKIVEEKQAEILKLTEQNRELTIKVTDLARDKLDLGRKIAKMKENSQSKQSKPSNDPQLRKTARPSSSGDPSESGNPSSFGSSDIYDQRRFTIQVDAEVLKDVNVQQSQPLQEPRTEGNASPKQGQNRENDNSPSKPESSPKKGESPAPDKKGDLTQSKSANDNHSNNNPDKGDNAAAVDPKNDCLRGTDNEVRSSPKSPVEDKDELVWPEFQDLKKKTDALTKIIHTLYQTAQTKKVESFLECAESILSAVLDVVALFEKPHQVEIKSVLQQLCESAHKLRDRCKLKDNAEPTPEVCKQLTEEVMSYAYKIAKAEKDLVTMAPKEDTDSGSAV